MNGERTIRVDDAGTRTETRAMRFDAGAIGKLERTPTGGIRVPARVTREGVLVYQRADGTTIRELRPADEVFREDSLASLADCAVTITHPSSGRVTPETFRQDSVGYVRGEGQRDGRFVAAHLVVQDADAIRRIDAGELVELSCGYSCRVEPTSGMTADGERYDAIQRDVTYNHVALLPRGGGRAGRDVALRLDGAGVEVATPPANDNPARDPARDPERDRRIDTMKTERIDGVDYVVGSNEWQQAHAKRMARLDAEAEELKAKIAELEAQLAAMKEELAGQTAALDEKSKALDEATDETKMDARIAARAALVEQARGVLGASVKLDGKTSDQIRREVLTKLDGAGCVEGKDASHVAIYFEARLKSRSSESLSQSRADALPPIPAPGNAAPAPAAAPVPYRMPLGAKLRG